MTLKSKSVLDALGTLLSADSSFKTVGYQDINFDESEALTPIVQLHISDGNICSKGSGYPSNPFVHTFTIQIDIIASAMAEFDIATIGDPESTPTQIATAIASGKLSTLNAENKAYVCFESIFNIVNGVNNRDFGLDEYTIKSRSLCKYKIGDNVLNGSLATVFFTADLELQVIEQITGLTPVEADDPGVSGVSDASLPD